MRSIIWDQQEFLFNDFRHIQCGNIKWQSEKHHLEMKQPTGEYFEVRPVEASLPHGIRLEAKTPIRGGELEKKDTKLIGKCNMYYEDGLYHGYKVGVKYEKVEVFTKENFPMPLSVDIVHITSQDGENWEEVCRSPIDALELTNIDGMSFFIDNHGKKEEKFKMVFCARPPKEQQKELWDYYKSLPLYERNNLPNGRAHCMYLCTSPDGKDWTMHKKPMMLHQSDTDTTVLFDELINKYVMYTRSMIFDRRYISRSETDDLFNWPPVRPIIGPQLDEPAYNDVYMNTFCTYPGLPQYRFMLPTIYQRNQQTSVVLMYSSFDGYLFSKLPNGPILRPAEYDEWNCDYIVTRKGLMPYKDGVGFIYISSRFPHKYPRWDCVTDDMSAGWAYWPKGRMSAIVADEHGEFTTGAVVRGNKLALNMHARRGGEISVKIKTKSGKTIASDNLFGNDTAIIVTWDAKPELGIKKGEEVSITFKLRCAEIFGFKWID